MSEMNIRKCLIDYILIKNNGKTVLKIDKLTQVLRVSDQIIVY